MLYQHTGTSAKTRSTTADVPQSSQPKRKGPKGIKSQAKRQRTTTPPPPPRSPIPVESSPSSPEAQIQQAPSPPQSQEEPQPEELQPEGPQPEEISADIPEQTIAPTSLIIASVVSSIQTSTAPPQGNIFSMKLLSMDLFFHFIIISVNLSADTVPSAAPADQPVVPLASTSQRREIALKQVSYLITILYFTNISSSNNSSPFSFRSKTLPTACSRLLSKFLRMKERKQALPKQLEFHRQSLVQSWKICQPSSIKIQPNWLMILIQPRLYSKLSEARSLPMPRRSSTRPCT